MAERRTVCKGRHVLLEKESLHVLEGKLLAAVSKSGTGNPCTDLAAHLERTPRAQSHGAVHHDFHLAADHAHVDGRGKDQTVARPEGFPDSLHIILEHTGTLCTAEAAVAGMNALIVQEHALRLRTPGLERIEREAQCVGSVAIPVRATAYAEDPHVFLARMAADSSREGP